MQELLLRPDSTSPPQTHSPAHVANATSSLGFNASRCSALNPVTVAIVSTTYIRFIVLAFVIAMPLRIRRRHRQEARMRNAAQEIRIERQNHVRILKLVLRVHVAAERRLRSRLATSR